MSHRLKCLKTRTSLASAVRALRKMRSELIPCNVGVSLVTKHPRDCEMPS